MQRLLTGAGCLPRQHRPRAAGQVASPRSVQPAGSPPARPVPRSAVGSLTRFVLFGGGVGLACSAAVPALATLMPWAAANALLTVASTLLGTELHARFTFAAGQRAQWRQHMQSAGSATVAYLLTSAAVLVLHGVRPSAGMHWAQAVYLVASALAGTGRFLVLRLYVFARGRAAGTDLASVRPAVAGAATVEDLGQVETDRVIAIGNAPTTPTGLSPVRSQVHCRGSASATCCPGPVDGRRHLPGADTACVEATATLLIAGRTRAGRR